MAARAGGRRAHEPVTVLDPADEVVPLRPDRTPHCDVVEARVEDVGDGGGERGEGLADRPQRRLRLRRLAQEADSGTAEEVVV